MSRSHTRMGWRSAVALVMMSVVGCGPEGWAINGPQQAAASQPADGNASGETRADPFGPLPLPVGFDSAKARLTLGQLPDDPAAPHKPTTRPAAMTDPVRGRLKEARLLFAEQRYSETVIEAEKAIRYEPSRADGHRLIALASLLLGNETRARAAAEKALALDPGSLPCHYVLGRSAEKADKTDEAIGAYRTALKCEASEDDRPYKALTQYYLGNLLFKAGYFAAAAAQLEAFEDAVAALGEKLADNPELASIARVHRGDAALTAAKALGYLGQYGPAADALRKATVRSARDLDLRAEYVRMLMRAKRVNLATEQAAQLLADSQGSSDAVELLVAVHSASGHPERAITTIKSVVVKQPDNVDLWLVYVDTLAAAGRESEALGTARDLLARHPESSAAKWKLIELYQNRGEWAAWTTHVVESIAADPGQASRAVAQFSRIPSAEIEPLIKQLESSPPASTQPADAAGSARDWVRGHLLERLDRVEDAGKAYGSALSRMPNFLPAALAAGELYLDRCRWKDAIRALESVQKARSTPSAQLEYMLGRGYEGLDQTADALAHYGKVGQIERGHVRAAMALARLQERAGDLNAAGQQYDKILAADGSYMPAREGVIRLLLAQVQNQPQTREQQAVVSRILSDMAEMQKTAPQDPATLRCAALVQSRSANDQKAYRDTLQQLVKQYPSETKTKEDLVRVLLGLRDYEPARQILKSLLASDRCSPIALELLVMVHVRRLEFDDALRQYARMVDMYPNRESWLEQYAQISKLMQKYDRSIEMYQRILKLDAVEGKAERELGYRDKMMQVYRSAKRFDEARELNLKWLADVKDDNLRRNYRGMLLATDLSAKDFDKYLARCREWLKDEPNNRELNQLEMLGLLKAERNDEAVAAALGWVAGSPVEERLDWMADVLESAHQYTGAIDIVRGLMATAPEAEKKRARLNSLASLYINSKRYDQAIVALKQLIVQSQSTNTEIYAYELQKLLARVYVQAGRPEESTRVLTKMLSDLDEEIRQANEQLDARFGKLSEAARSESDKKKLLAQLDQTRKAVAASAAPRKAELLRQMYWAYQKQGQLEVGEQRLREALALAPNDSGISNDLGYTLADSGRNLKEAKELTSTAVGQDPTTAAYLDSYAWVLYKRGEFAEAKRWLEWASGLELGEDPVIYDHLGDVRWRAGDKQSAVETWKRSLEINEKQNKEGEDAPEKDLPDRVKKKIEAAQAGEKPAVAQTGAESRPE